MAKILCRLINIYAPEGEMPSLMKRLQEMAVIDIETSAEDEQTAGFPEGYSRPDTAASADIYERGLNAAEDALKILSEKYPEKKGLLSAFSGPPEIEENDFYLQKEDYERALSLAGDILNNDRITAERHAEIIRLRTTAEQLVYWEKLDVPLSFKGTAKTAAFIGTVSGNYTLEGLLEALARANPEISIHAEIVSNDKDNTFIFACCPAEQRDAAEDALRQLSFARPVQMTSRLPAEKIKSKLQRIAECEKRIEECKESLKKASEHRRELEIFADFCRAKADSCRRLGETGRTAHTVLIRGYVAEPDADLLKETLEKEFTAVVEIGEADESRAPVKLKNNKVFSPAETITTMYSLPSAQDIDPTPLTGFFYYLLFGMMLSDAGYGLLIVIGTLLGIKLLKPSAKMKQTLKMFFYCGISTVFWGLIFGSFFGDIFAQIGKTFFGVTVPSWGLLDPMNGDAVTLLVLSLVIGFVQIIAGLSAKFVTCMKNGDKAGAFFDAGLWITTLLGIGILAVGIVGPKICTTIGAAVAIASAVGLILTQGRDKKGIMRIFGGIASLYDITGYVSDLLSFSRLMALGLTTAAMGSVFNMLGTMAGGGIVGALLMLVIFPLGHALCFALNALGAYVHTLRLQYVELFSKFYDGGGKPFKAFSLRNKYVGVKSTAKEEN